MSGVLVRRTQRRQPQGLTRVEWAHPMALGLLSAAIPWGYDSKFGAGWWEIGSDLSVPGGRDNLTFSEVGLSRTFGTSTSGVGLWLKPGTMGEPSGSRVNHTRAFAVMVTGTASTVNTTVSTNRPTGNGGLGVRVLSTRALSLVNQGISGFLNATITLDIGRVYFAVARLTDNGTNTTSEIIIDGTVRGTTTSATSFAHDAAQFSRIGGNATSMSGAGDYLHIPLHYAWDRSIADQEVEEFFRNPWQIFEPRRILVSVPAVGGAPTLSDLQAASITATTVQGTYDYAF